MLLWGFVIYRVVILALSYWSLNTVLRVRRESLGVMIKRIDSIDSTVRLPGFKTQLHQPCILEQILWSLVFLAINWGPMSLGCYRDWLSYYQVNCLILIKHISMLIIIAYMWKEFKAIKSPVKHETIKAKNIPQVSDLWYPPAPLLKPHCAPGGHQSIKKWILRGSKDKTERWKTRGARTRYLGDVK